MSTTTNSLIQPHYLANTSALFSAFILASNSYFLFNPRVNLGQLGYKPATSQPVAEALMRMNAASRIALATGGLAMWWYRDYRAIGWSNIAGAVMAFTDGWVSDALGGSPAAHWGAMPIGLGIGVGLLALVGI